MLFFSTYASCGRLWRPVPFMQIVIFLLMPTVTVLYFYLDASYDDLCRVNRELYLYLCQPCWTCWVLLLYLCQLCYVLTTCARYEDCYICSYASRDDLWRARVPGMQMLYFYLCSCAGHAKCCFSTNVSCTKLWRPVPEMQSVMCHLCRAPSVVFLGSS